MSETNSLVELSMLEMQMNHLDQALDDNQEVPIRRAAGGLSFFLASHPEEYSTGIRWLEERIALASSEGKTLAYLEGVRDALSGARAAMEEELRLRKLGLVVRGPRLLSLLEALVSEPLDLESLATRLDRQSRPLLRKDIQLLEQLGLLKEQLETNGEGGAPYIATVTGHTIYQRIQKEQAELLSTRVRG